MLAFSCTEKRLSLSICHTYIVRVVGTDSCIFSKHTEFVCERLTIYLLLVMYINGDNRVIYDYSASA